MKQKVYRTRSATIYSGVNFFLKALFILPLTQICFAAPNCTNCTTIKREIASVSAEESKANQLLEENKKALALIPANDVSKRIKITSNIMILSAKVETHGNNKSIKSQEFQKMECQSCPTI